MKTFGLYIVAGMLLFGAFWLISQSARAQDRAQTRVLAGPVLHERNNWDTLDQAGKRVRATQLLAIHKGKLSAWEPSRGWIDSEQESGLYGSVLSEGCAILRVELESWPVIKDDRAYSLHDVGVVSWPTYIEILVSPRSLKQGRTSLVYSRAPWREAGRMSSSGEMRGSVKGLKETHLGPPEISEGDRLFLLESTQQALEADQTEFSYEISDDDRALDRRVLFDLGNGKTIPARRFKTKKGRTERVAWRAPIPPEQVQQVILEERPVLVAEITDLPNPNE